MTEDLWGELPDAIRLKSPEDILQEQAALLSTKTGSKLLGVVATRTNDGRGGRRSLGECELTLSIRVPVLNDFIYEICEIRHAVLELYPANIYLPDSDHGEEDAICDNADEFTRALGQILGGPKTRNVIASLLKQVMTRSGQKLNFTAATTPTVAPPDSDDDIPF